MSTTTPRERIAIAGLMGAEVSSAVGVLTAVALGAWTVAAIMLATHLIAGVGFWVDLRRRARQAART